MNKTKICVSICAETIDGFAAQIENAAGIADIIELRFDCLLPGELRLSDGSENAVNVLLKKFPDTEFLVTFRSIKEGGHGSWTDDERNTFWNSGFKTEIVDFEYDISDSDTDCSFKSKIVSIHTESIDQLPKSFPSTTADYLKIAAPVSDAAQSLEIWKFIIAPKPTIPIAMGEAGKWTRILGPAFGAPLAYASLSNSGQTAPGQITAADLRDVYRVKELGRETQIFGIIGNPVSHSLSPFIHNAAFKEDGLDAVYVPFEVSDLPSFFEKLAGPLTREIDWNLNGLSVTFPFKEAVINELDFLDETAEAIGAVNTIRVVDKQLVGFNTDADGFIEPLKGAFGELKNAKVAVIGAGGAARACIYALIKEGARPSIFARNPEKASAVAQEFGCEVKILTEDKSLFEGYQVIVNATPAGTSGELENTTPVTSAQMKNLQLVYDLVYNPYETLFLREAAKAGIPSISGLEMLISQAAQQYKIWTGKEAPIAVMSRAALSRLS